MQEFTLAVVGIDFPNENGSNRRSEAMMTQPGAPIKLVLEPKNKHDPNAISVFSPQGVQIGYMNAERAPYVGLRMGRGEDVTAIFQGIDDGSAFIRVRFGGGVPTLPLASEKQPASSGPPRPMHRSEPLDPHSFQPDEEGPEWGA
ncbi:HIRAN domain-containing protein [Sphingomonas sp. NFR15]|uniref:HIRAN domain-containing protein n=1 Tax=Sphingomonas sp. NFR15 TaxID=1566282 RepID=UPI0008917A08|nr:HIRAN domain-containing protein [Sphingomonas sp. NFR15]SDA36893.1 HIRAN domain-containing protein [Sphingomonas sp. NFR15]